MTSSSQRSEQRAAHSDYIARIRYSNKLPPPPNPPKLLNIPGTGLDARYLDGNYHARLVREQPVNIEVDSELGMPINLVGMPGVFDGDETCIQGLDDPPAPHPGDKPLLKPLSALGKAAASASGVSFLRRTEYMSSNQNARMEPSGARDVLRQKSSTPKRKHDEISQDTPARIIRDIEMSFALANGDAQANGEPGAAGATSSTARGAWTNPKHPTKPGLKLLDSYPIVPDVEATPDTGSFGIMRYSTNPVAESHTYDERLDVAILRPRDPRPEVMQMWQAQKQEREAKGSRATEQQPYDYDLFLAGDKDAVEGIQMIAQDAGADGEQSFEFPRVRTYETVHGELLEPFEDSIALALVDGERNERDNGRGLAKGAYFYPIGSRTVVRPARAGWGHAASGDAVVDMLDVSYRAADEKELKQRSEYSNGMYEAPLVEAAS